MGITLDRLVFDPANADDYGNVGAYIRASDGTLITNTSGFLDVYIQNANLDVTVGNTVAVSGSVSVGNTVAVSGSVTVSASDLDIRDLTHVSDSVKIGDGTDLLAVITGDATGAVATNGLYMLGIRQDAAGSPVSADGDFHPFVFNNDGELKVAADLTSDIADDAVDSGNPIKVGSKTQGGILTAVSASGDRANLLSDTYRRVFINDAPNIGLQCNPVSVPATGAINLTSSPLTGRTKMIVQNKGSKPVYLGASGVVASGGIELSTNSSIEVSIGDDINLYAISSSGTQDIRVFEIG